MHIARTYDAGVGTSFIDPKALAKIDSLELVARTVVEGFLNGLHRSPNLGASMDFAEHRAYMPGDDLRRIDWRLFGRSDRFFVKEFEADTNTNLLLRSLPIARTGTSRAVQLAENAILTDTNKPWKRTHYVMPKRASARIVPYAGAIRLSKLWIETV